MAATPVVIAAAGPLIALARLQALDLLPRLFGQVLITPTVHEEILPPGDFPGTAALQAALEAGWLCCQAVSPTAERPLHPGVDPGEASVIALALQEPDALLLMDDRTGRAAARRRGIPFLGTAAVIGLATLHGLIPAARPLLEQFRSVGYFISQEVIDAVLADIGEE
jgi:predicted nucleic acid-binding protein